MRKIKFSAAAVALVLGVTLILDAFAQAQARYPELPNFHHVNDQLYRGAQPKEGGLETLKKLGVRAIVNLRNGAEATPNEGDEARRLGLRYYNVPLPDLSAPQDKDVQLVLDIISDKENKPVFVHCRHGEDRTGTIIACYRISHDDWTAAEAKAEAQKLGMSWTQMGMKRYIDKFYQRRQKRTGQTNVLLKREEINS